MKQTLLTLILFLATLLAGAQVIEETAPQPVQPKAPTYNSSLLLDADVDCRVFVDGEQKAEVKAGEPLKIKLNAGQHLLQIKDMNNAQLHKEVVELEKDRQFILSVALSGGVSGGGVIDKSVAKVTCIWLGDKNIRMSLNSDSYFLSPNNPQQLELTPGEGYLLKLQKPEKTLAFPDFLVFNPGTDSLFLRIDPFSGVVAENAEQRAATMKRVRQTIQEIENNMVKIPGGTFTMGSTVEGDDDEKPAHSVTLSAFYMGRYEVTVSQFKAFIDATGYNTTADLEGGSKIIYTDKWEWETIEGVNWQCDAMGKPQAALGNNYPVIHVSWYDATSFCSWLSDMTGKSFHLPSEAEWEYAAGNGVKHTKYSWGYGSPTGKSGGNVADESLETKLGLLGRTMAGRFIGYDDGYIYTAPVGRFNPNEFGLYDMTGNVWEWCADWYGENYYASSPANNPQGPSSGSYRVGRGGSWYGSATFCRVANRRSDTPDGRFSGLGFRLSRMP